MKAPDLKPSIFQRNLIFRVLFGIGILVALYMVSRHNYLVFHTLAEFFSIAVAWSLFLIFWNTREVIENKSLILLGICYFFIGVIDLMHTLSYKGMGVLGPETGANPATQLWIFARYMESLTLCVFASMRIRAVYTGRTILLFCAVVSLGLLSIFYWNNFPACYIDGIGLTKFKIFSEYLICVILIVALLLLKINKKCLDHTVYRSMIAAIILTIFAELAFTFYVSVYGLSNLLGHYFKILSFYFVYRALIRSGLSRPYTILFQNIEEEKEALKKSQQELHNSEQTLRAMFNATPLAMVLLDKKGIILDSNEEHANRLKTSREKILGKCIWNLLPEVVSERRKTRVESVFETGTPVSEQDKRGTTWNEYHIHPAIRNDKNEIEAVIVEALDITDRKRFEEELRFQSLLLDQISDRITATDLEGNITYVNQAVMTATQRSREELIGQNVKIYGQDPSQGATQQEIIKNTLEKGHWSGEIINHKPDGTKMHMQCRTQLIKDESDTQIGMVGISTDITYRREKEAEYSKILHTTIDGFWVIDKSGRLLETNPAAAHMLGYTQQEMINLSINDIEALEDPDVTKKRMESIIHKGFARFETIHRRKDGSLVDIEVSTSYLPVGEGKFVAFMRDISIRKKLERENQIHKLRMEIVQKMATLTNSDEKEICDFVLEKMLSLSGSQIGFLGYISEDEQTMQIHSWSSSAMAQCKIQNKPISFPIDQSGLWGEPVRQRRPVIVNEYTAPHPAKKGFPDGHVTIFRFMEVPVFENDRIVAIAAVGNKEDRYEEFDSRQLIRLMDNWWEQIRRKRMIAQEKKIQANLQRIQKMEAIGNLAGGIAHDFNNILFPIVGMSEMLLEDLSQESVEYENAREIFKAGRRGADLVKQILAFSRQSEHTLMPVRIQKVLKDVLSMIRSTIPANIQINQDIQHDCGMIHADSTQIHQIAMNLITNAYHAVEPTNGEISITLKETDFIKDDLLASEPDPGKYAEITVSDTGSGIDEELLNKIFEPYFTTKKQGKGTGLGLSVVHGIVKNFNGTIQVDSQVGVGTTFKIYFPLLVGKEDQAFTETLESLPTGVEKILLVDDEEAIAKLQKQMLERLGYHVTIRTNSLEALKTFVVSPAAFDLVITDMAMPNMTGEQLTRELIAIRQDIPIIICTGFSEKLDDQKSKAIGVKGLLMKPIVKSEMAKTIRKVLDETK